MKYLIVAGHGKNTPGKRSPDGKLREWQFNRVVAHFIDFALPIHGVKCELINPGPIEIPLKSKAKYINSEAQNNDICAILIHANAAPGDGWSEAGGTRVLVPKKRQWGTNKKWRLSQKIGEIVTRAFSSNISIPYCTRNIRESNLYMLRKLTCPVVLIECGFMTSEVDKKYMSTGSGQKEIASTITSAIALYEETK